MPYSLQLISDPATEPVSTTDAKAHLNVEHSRDDAMIGVMITAARRHVETRANRALVRQKWRTYYDCWSDVLPLGKGPSIAVDAVNYIDENGAAQIVGNTESPMNPGDYYGLDVPNECIRLVYAAAWPTARMQANAIWIDHFAGYANTAASPQGTVPADLRVAILMLVAHLYEHRESRGDLETFENPAFDMLVGAHWLPR